MKTLKTINVGDKAIKVLEAPESIHHTFTKIALLSGNLGVVGGCPVYMEYNGHQLKTWNHVDPEKMLLIGIQHIELTEVSPPPEYPVFYELYYELKYNAKL